MDLVHKTFILGLPGYLLAGLSTILVRNWNVRKRGGREGPFFPRTLPSSLSFSPFYFTPSPFFYVDELEGGR
jgi:hypothetical protein